MENKTILGIQDVMKLYGAESRTTFWRMRKKKVVPEPDIASGYPKWFRATLEQHTPNLPTNPST